ncbi:MAG: HEAT repeat domain-containing protein, partial [Candidatus Omnitrophica bacterium]|nr:HEAT repeat domain-containing protein [Candidatus Omnitrophota bacterium]
DRSILVRLQAIESLEEFRKSTLRGEIVRKLLKQLASVNQIEQLRLIKTLGLIGEQTEIESDLLEKISTNNEAMVTTVIEALGRIKSTSSIKIFSQLIEDNQERNEVIIEALSSIGSPEALQVLINRLLHKKNPEVRIAAIEAIGKFEGESGQEELVKEFYLELATAIKEADSVKWADFNSYSEISALMNAIERKITVNNDSTNELAIKRLLESKKEYERIVVLSLLTEGNPYDRNVIGSRAEDQSLFPLLEQTVSDPSIFIRIWGIHALGNMTNSGVISILEKAIMDPVFGIRYAAVKSLVRYAHNTSNYSPLRKLFEQKDNFIPTVYTKEDKNFLIRESIEEAIVAVEPEYLTHQRRISELTSSSAPTRMIAALQLVEKSDNLSIPVLIVFLKEGTIGEQQSALGGLEKFYRLPQDAILHLQAIHAKIDDMTLKEKINQIIIKSQKLCNEEDVN